MSSRTRALLLSACLVLAAASGVAQAKDIDQAEHERLSGEIESLAGRGIWEGVERKFRDLERLETDLTFDDLVHGATAARELGDVSHCYDRLRRALKVKASRDLVDWMWDIDTHYGRVELLTVPNRGTELTVDKAPLDPNQRKAIEAAQESARRDGIFVGMLPAGTYSFSTQRFSVEPGVDVRIEVSPRVRRQGVVDPVIIYRDELGNPTTRPPGPSGDDAPPSQD
ncbi:MAG: hypothetical protein H6742_05580 [Alphaproteobacteria bacterium]|nr:hypothetical protein [Alphaproteobacteria bacterium]